VEARLQWCKDHFFRVTGQTESVGICSNCEFARLEVKTRARGCGTNIRVRSYFSPSAVWCCHIASIHCGSGRKGAREAREAYKANLRNQDTGVGCHLNAIFSGACLGDGDLERSSGSTGVHRVRSGGNLAVRRQHKTKVGVICCCCCLTVQRNDCSGDHRRCHLGLYRILSLNHRE